MSTPLPLEAFYDHRRITDLALSPGGERVAFVVDEFDRADDERHRSLFVVPADGSRDPYRLSRASAASAPRWSPSGSKLGFLAAREPDVGLVVGTAPDEGDDADEGERSADDDPETQLWVFDLERGGDARQVTDRTEGVRGFDWSPDGERVVVAARDPTDDEREYLDTRRDDGPIETERLQHKHDEEGWLDTVRTYLFVVDIDTREERRLDATGFEPGLLDVTGGREPAWGPRGIAFRGYEGERPDDTYESDIYLVDSAGETCRRLTDGGVTAGRPVWSPDGSRLAFRAGDPENWYRPAELCVTDPETRRCRSVSASLDRTLGDGTATWLDDGTLLATVGDEGWTRLVRFRVDGDPERVFDRQSRNESIRRVDAAGGRIAVLLSRPSAGLDVHTMPTAALDASEDSTGEGATEESDRTDVDDGSTTDSDRLTRITATNDALIEEYGGLRVERVRFDSDGTTVEGLAYLPPGFDPGEPNPHPLVLAIHGGPMAYDQPGWDFNTACLTTRGYVVFRVNYRGSTSYGRAFSEALKGRWNSLEVADLLAGVDALVERDWADPERLFVTGFSQGGINTAYLLTHTDRFAAAAAEHGIYDARSAFGTDDSHAWWEWDFGLPWENPEAYDAVSSITDVGAIETPLLVTAGGEDWRCPPTQAEQLYVSVRKRGIEARLVVYPDEHHDIGDPDRAVHRLRQLTTWFERHDPTTETTDSGALPE